MPVPISNVTRRAVYAPSGAGGAGPYAFTFEILANTDIAVYKDDVLLTLTTHYTVTINANGTGSVTITAAGLALSPTSPTQYAIVGNRTISRTTDFVTGGDFFANTLNDELDQQTIFAQQNAEGLQRALQAPQTDPTTIDMTLPRAADRANKTLAFDANGDPTLGISAADVANAVTYASNAATSATAAAASASAAAGSASSASGSASTATTQASNASSSASSASTSASNASTSATNAANSASTATTQATNASNSASSASTSASNASTSASNAATSATNAANSASSAATSASNAATSETNAAASAAAAATALDNFDDRYLGAKTSNPTVDNDGNALVTGALYYRSTAPIGMKVYDGSQWLEASAAQQAALVTYEYVATAGQTTFSGADANTLTLSYIAGGLIVSLNGAILRPGDDYTATNGTSVVLLSAASASDEVCIYAFSSFQVSNTYTQAQADSRYAQLSNNLSDIPTKATARTNLGLAIGTDVQAYSAELQGISQGGNIGMKNRIINGAFAVAQRGTSFTSTGSENNDDTYNLDRWYLLSDGNDAVDVTQNTAASDTGDKYNIALDVETVNKKFGIAQIIENINCYDLQNQAVTVSFKAKVSSTTKLDNIKCAIVAWSGTADTVTSDIISAWNVEGTNPTLIANATYENTPANLNVTTSWATYSVTATVDTASTGNVIVFIWSDVTDTTLGDFLYITNVQLEKGSTATSFDYRPYGTELALCQRYYYKIFPQDTNSFLCAGYVNSSTTALLSGFYPVTMRIAPTALEQSGTASNYRIVSPVGSANCSSVPTFSAPTNQYGFVVNFTVASGLTTGYGATGRTGDTTGANGYLAWSAEL